MDVTAVAGCSPPWHTVGTDILGVFSSYPCPVSTQRVASKIPQSRGWSAPLSCGCSPSLLSSLGPARALVVPTSRSRGSDRRPRVVVGLLKFFQGNAARWVSRFIFDYQANGALAWGGSLALPISPEPSLLTSMASSVLSEGTSPTRPVVFFWTLHWSPRQCCLVWETTVGSSGSPGSLLLLKGPVA